MKLPLFYLTFGDTASRFRTHCAITHSFVLATILETEFDDKRVQEKDQQQTFSVKEFKKKTKATRSGVVK